MVASNARKIFGFLHISFYKVVQIVLPIIVIACIFTSNVVIISHSAKFKCTLSDIYCLLCFFMAWGLFAFDLLCLLFKSAIRLLFGQGGIYLMGVHIWAQ